MHFILGGRSQGKRQYAESLNQGAKVLDLAKDAGITEWGDFGILINLQDWVSFALKRNEDPLQVIENVIPLLKNKIIAGDEIGCGIVPVDSFDRLWRDETGRVYQLICRNADVVDRVFAGIPVRIKGGNE